MLQLLVGIVIERSLSGVKGINMNIITVGSYPRCNNGLEYDLGVTCIGELVYNLFGVERCSSGFVFRLLFTRHVLQNHENPDSERASTILANFRERYWHRLHNHERQPSHWVCIR